MAWHVMKSFRVFDVDEQVARFGLFDVVGRGALLRRWFRFSKRALVLRRLSLDEEAAVIKFEWSFAYNYCCVMCHQTFGLVPVFPWDPCCTGVCR